MKLAPTIIENLEYADIVRGSLEDFLYMYNMQDIDKIYKDKIKFYCPRFICTAGGEKVALRTNLVNKDYPVAPLQAVSTIGAGAHELFGDALLKAGKEVEAALQWRIAEELKKKKK